MLRILFFSLLLPVGLFATRAIAEPPAAHEKVVVCFGDSLTAGYGAPPGQGYPNFLESDLIEKGLHPRIVNEGESGATTKDALVRLPAIVAMHPDIAILEFGANDGLRGAPVSGISANLGVIIETLEAAHVRVLLAGIYLPPNYGPEYVQQFDAVYPALARKYKLPLIPFLLKDVYGVPGLMSNDSVHPNGEGYQVVARTVMAGLLPMLKK